MTDNEIVKVLECCTIYRTTDVRTYKGMPLEVFSEATLDLINRQKAEIERLSEDVDGYKAELESEHLSRMDNIHDLITEIKKSKVEAIKEFAERLSERAPHITEERFLILRDEIDNLVKEMTEEANNAE